MRIFMGQPSESYSAVQLADGSYSVRSEVHQETFHPLSGPRWRLGVFISSHVIGATLGPRCKSFVCGMWVLAGKCPLHLMRAHEKTHAAAP